MEHDKKGAQQRRERSQKLVKDKEYHEAWLRSQLFSQARRRAAEKPVTLPKLKFLEKSDLGG